MAFCRRCGMQVLPGARFCGECGHRQNSGDPTGAGAGSVANAPAAPQEEAVREHGQSHAAWQPSPEPVDPLRSLLPDSIVEVFDDEQAGSPDRDAPLTLVGSAAAGESSNGPIPPIKVFCTMCGAKHRPDAVFCPACGEPLEE